MPGGDRTGPRGQGPKTGWGTGYCSGANQPGFVNQGSGRRAGFGKNFQRGCGFGGGRKRGRNMNAEYQDLEGQYRQGEFISLQQQINEIKNRLDELTLKKET